MFKVKELYMYRGTYKYTYVQNILKQIALVFSMTTVEKAYYLPFTKLFNLKLDQMNTIRCEICVC